MKLMTYNILDGGGERLGGIIDIVKREAPDVLVINEANGFSADGNEVLKRFSAQTGLQYGVCAGTEFGYDIAVFSKTIFSETETLMPGKRAAMRIEVGSPFGTISVVGLHLSPTQEEVRLLEIQTIMESQEGHMNAVMMGDMNALSRRDGYSATAVAHFNETQKKKFTKDGVPRYEVIDAVMSAGYQDSGVLSKQNAVTTVPTPSNTDAAHADLRLDYIFLSEALAPHLASYRVIKDATTDGASDHYPVIVELR